MIKVEAVEDIYPAIDELINILSKKDESEQELSKILYHRMHKVSWTTRSELFAELKGILTIFVRKQELEDSIKIQIKKIIAVIKT